MGHKNKGKAKKRSKARDKNGMETVSSAVLETLGGSEHDIASPAELIDDMSGAPDLTRGRLRKKLGTDNLETVRGLGYRLAGAPSAK